MSATGKPKKPAEKKEHDPTKKETSIHIRVTDDQKQVLVEAAESVGIGLSAFLLSTAMKEAKRLKSER
jgi:uncharacterized protein (DUF1778 family)